jgi:hypothetical protein
MYKEIIQNIKPFDYSQYVNISSNEKLAAYACYYLDKEGVPLTFNYICVACYKLFPDKFYFDEEFKEYPHIEKLNRTILHMHTNKNYRIIIGSAKRGYQLTNAGRILAKQIESDILNKEIDNSIGRKKIMDPHKKGVVQDYNKLLHSEFFINNKGSSGDIDLTFLWDFFQVIPYTQISKIKDYFIDVKNYAKSVNDEVCIDFCENILLKI